MASPKKGGQSARARNDARPCGKAFKKNPGVAPGAHNGKTVDGYSPATLAARAATRRLSGAEND